jgi:uncharacterized protein YdhG (YjbR/CyaY superfamily)
MMAGRRHWQNSKKFVSAAKHLFFAVYCRQPMPSAQQKPASIEAYIAAAPVETRAMLRQLHACIQKAAPGATEAIKWSMPAFSYSRILVSFAVFKKHIGFYITPSAIRAFKTPLAPYKTAAGSVQLPLDKLLPLVLIGKMVRFRVKEIREADVKWKS